MEVFMRGIPFSMGQSQLKGHLANIFHSSDYSHHSPRPLNFDVQLRRKVTKRGTRTGIITVPTEEVGEQFLGDYEHDSSNRRNTFGTITFERGRKAPNRRVLKAVRETPYKPPLTTLQPTGDTVSIQRLQFGWYCSDEEYSVEWQEKFSVEVSATLEYREDRRQFQLKVMDLRTTRIMAIRVNQVYWAASSPDQSGEPSIFFYLNYPPSFEAGPPDREFIDKNSDTTSDPLRTFSMRQLFQVTKTFNPSYKIVRRRQGSFDGTHLPIAPYTSIAIRLVCQSVSDIAGYIKLCERAHLPVDYSSPPPVVRRGLFSEDVRAAYQQWTASLEFVVAFQVESLLSKWLLHMREAVKLLRPAVTRLISDHGADIASSVLADLGTRLESRVWYGDGVEINENTTKELLAVCLRQINHNRIHTLPHSDLFLCNHLYITASATILDGPLVERSNRVIRQYWDHRDSFLRVHFTDDNKLAYRYDSEINLQDLVERRVRRFLLEGISVAGQHFEFLGYSQSALKSHSVWFVKPFKTTDGHTIDAATIIDRLGNFRENPYDPKLIFCPARYAARISQAFSATESSITIAVENMEIVDDIEDDSGTYSFTDGNGTMSLQVARDIAEDQRSKTRVRRAWRMHRGSIPRVLQVRIAGSKGMLHVDHKLEGRKIRLPKSMVKFSAPSSNRIEIAQLFEEPSAFNLNRPMIMLLEGLGVPYEVFKRLQDSEVRAAHALTESLANSGWLLDKYGLGNSFKLPSAILQLHKLGVPLTSLTGNSFWRRVMSFSVNHVLRELKYHARIPVPGGWTLVGIADTHGQLREGEIYVCVRTADGREVYLEGPTLITRSPAIHPGDIQVVHAIGKPADGSDIAQAGWKNCVAFSTRGDRPLPSYLGGGDLDGDMYNVTCVPQDLLPPIDRLCKPASYSPAKRKMLSRPSTMRDVADFVAEFIISDDTQNVGLIATTWLTLADRVGIFDQDCLRLAELHNAAVDYPKTGLPVPVDSDGLRPILRRKRETPDWYMPETTLGRPPQYYRSNTALGRLFRAIDLPMQDERNMNSSYFGFPEIDEENGVTLDDVLADIRAEPFSHRSLLQPVVAEVRQYLSSREPDETLVTMCWNLFTAYASSLRGICAAHAVSASRSSMLTEEEVIVGTIAAKCAQTRKRTDMIAHLREQTTTLVNGICAELSDDGHLSPSECLAQAWTAYRVSCTLSERFGGQSFGWIALGEIFDAIQGIKEERERGGGVSSLHN
ncbi:RdRP-domain-containing protein [Daedalea quercina L-15889]|uniref:RNA-dependent RNA polymerase n=1 Tax=Daedalea quercina L-15889 TaxID=1314783 RepID=A0A165KLW7_9APHY|nr:RdRP-domain-containing protein [Daedalea quercina L-15889]